MSTTFAPGERVMTPDGTLAVFIRLVDEGTAIIRVGVDTHLVDPVTLRSVQ
jgi:hypothetical protein